jgi:hypothetical protein
MEMFIGLRRIDMGYFERCKNRIEESESIEMVELVSELFEGRTYIVDGELAIRGRYSNLTETAIFTALYNYTEIPLLYSDKKELYELAESKYNETNVESVRKSLEDL